MNVSEKLAQTHNHLTQAQAAHDAATKDVLRELGITRRALALACERIADGPQQYAEANTPDGWQEVFTLQARLNVKLFRDGDQWCALRGPDLQEGKAAFGETPERALGNWASDHGEHEGGLVPGHPSGCPCWHCGQAWCAANYSPASGPEQLSSEPDWEALQRGVDRFNAMKQSGIVQAPPSAQPAEAQSETRCTRFPECDGTCECRRSGWMPARDL